MTALRRRDVLVGLSTVGVAGALSGYGTRAAFIDREEFGNELVAGALDLVVEWESLVDDASGSSDGLLRVDLGELQPGDEGAFKVALDLPQGDHRNNPAYAWLRTFCPTTTGRIAESLSLTLSYATGSGTPVGDPLFEGSLCEFGEAFGAGRALDAGRRPGVPAGSQRCVDTADTVDGGPLYLHVAYALDAYHVGSGNAVVSVAFGALACRHATGTENPFVALDALESCTCRHYHGVSYVKIYGCDPDEPGCDCVPIGKFELDPKYADCLGVDADVFGENYVAPGRYDLLVDDDCEGTGYDLVIRDTVTKPDGEVVGLAFSVEGDGDRPDPTLCQIEVKGGRGSAFYGPDALRENGTLDYVYAPEKLQ